MCEMQSDKAKEDLNVLETWSDIFFHADQHQP